jgi:hypothetical protein
MDTREAIRRLETDEFITLWTLQHIGVWEKLKMQGFVRGDGRYAMSTLMPGFRIAYKWLMEEMKKRIPEKPLKRGFPIWAWYYPKPDLREFGFAPHRCPFVKIELKVKREKILATCFDAWEVVLIGESLAFCCERIGMEESWERIFDFDKLNDMEFLGGGVERIQVVMYEITMDEVRSVKFYKARKF